MTRDIAPCPTSSSCINMPSVRIFTAWIPCYTFSATIATNWIMRLSSERVNGARCRFSKDNICQKAHLRAEQDDGLSRERGKRELCSWMRSQLFFSVHGHYKFFLFLSSFKFDISLLSIFSISTLLLYGRHELIKNEWRRPLKLFTEILEHDWWYFYPFYSWERESVIF